MQRWGMAGSEIPPAIDNNGSQVPALQRAAAVGQYYSPAMAATRTAPSGNHMSLSSMGIGNFAQNRDMVGISAQGRQAGQTYNPYVNSGVAPGAVPNGGMNAVQMARQGQPPREPQHEGAATAAYRR